MRYLLPLLMLPFLAGCAGKFDKTVRGTWKVDKIDRKLYVNDNFNDVRHLSVDGTITFDRKDGNYDMSVDYVQESASFTWTSSQEGDQWKLTIDPGKWTEVFGTPPREVTVVAWGDNSMQWRFVDTVYYKNNASYRWEQEWHLTKQ